MDLSEILVSPSKGICTLFSETGNVVCYMVGLRHCSLFLADRNIIFDVIRKFYSFWGIATKCR